MQQQGNYSGSWEISARDKAKYDAMFREAGGSQGYVTGPQMASLSDLPLADKGHIFRVSDLDKDVKLSKSEFAIAMFLVDRRKEGCSIPHSLPQSLISSAASQSQLPQSQLPPPFNPNSLSPTNSNIGSTPSTLPPHQASIQYRDPNQILADKDSTIATLQHQLRETQQQLHLQQERAQKLMQDLAHAQDHAQRTDAQLAQLRRSGNAAHPGQVQRSESQPLPVLQRSLVGGGGGGAGGGVYQTLAALDLEHITSKDELDALCSMLKEKLTQAKQRKVALQELNQQRKIDELESTLLCPICMDQKKNVSCVPCGHALCRSCADSVFTTRNKKCPLCRVEVQQTNSIYL